MQLFKQIFSYGSIGIFLLIFSLIIYYITFEVFDFPLYPIYILTYIVTIAISYFLNARHTFKSSFNKTDFFKYYIVYMISLLVGLGLLYVLELNTNWSKFILTIATIGPRVAISFILSKYYIFKDSNAGAY